MNTHQRSIIVSSLLSIVLTLPVYSLSDGFKLINPQTRTQSTMSLVQKSFYFIRHGQTDWNIVNRLQGQLDIPLNDTGRAQAQALQDAVKSLDITQVYFSPLSRTFETMQIACVHIGHIPQTPIINLMERNFGEWQGEIWDQEAVTRHANAEPIYGETEEEYYARVVNCANDLLAECDGQLLMVAHGGVFWSLCKAASIDYDVIPNGKVLHFIAPSQDNDQWCIETI